MRILVVGGQWESNSADMLPVQTYYHLEGHGSLMMASTVEELCNTHYIKRQMPELMEVK